MPPRDFRATSGIKPFDPAGFQISVVMITPDGVQVPLWMRGTDAPSGTSVPGTPGAIGLGGTGGNSPPGEELLALDLPIVESVSVELSLGLIGKVTVGLGTTYELGLKLLESAFFLIGNVIAVKLSYPRAGRETMWMEAITQKPSITVSADEGLSATLNADGGGFAALRGGEEGKVFVGQSYLEVIAALAKGHGWQVFVDGEPADEIVRTLAAGPAGSTFAGFDTKHPLVKRRASISQGKMSDWFLIQHAARMSRCDAFIGPGQDGRHALYVISRNSMFAGTPRFKFMSRGNVDFDRVFPLLDFSTEAEFVWLPGGGIKATTSDINPDDKRVERWVAEALAEQAGAQPGGQTTSSGEKALGESRPSGAKKKVGANPIQLANTDGAEFTGEYTAVSARDPSGAEDVINTMRSELGIRGGINATVTSYGVPELLPGELVQLDGLGVFNGLYGVNSLTHTANDTEWMMSMELLNNATASGMIQRFFTSPADDSNVSTVDEDGDSQGVSGTTLVDPTEEQDVDDLARRRIIDPVGVLR